VGTTVEIEALFVNTLVRLSDSSSCSTMRGTMTRPPVPTVVSPDDAGNGAAAAAHAAAKIASAVAERGRARVLFASAPSQEAFLAALCRLDVPWDRVEAFHIDEYVGIDPDAPQAFGRWLDDRLFSRVPLAAAHRVDPQRSPDEASRAYGDAVSADVVDLACIGIGVNGHIAFNEPYRWSIDDPLTMRPVELDARSRRQQVDDGCFARLADVPTHAVTLTVPALLRAASIVVTVPGRHKAPAVAATLQPGITPATPATALQSHPDAMLFVDAAAAALIGEPSAAHGPVGSDPIGTAP